MTTSSPSLYEVLDVAPEADRRTVARAWRIRRDRVSFGDYETHEAEAICAKLDEAFSILASPTRAARYQAYRSGARPTAGAMEFGRDGAVRAHPDRTPLDAAKDPSLPPVHDDASWAEAPTNKRVRSVDADHLLPITDRDFDAVPAEEGEQDRSEAAFETSRPRPGVRRTPPRRSASGRLLKAMTSAPWI